MNKKIILLIIGLVVLAGIFYFRPNLNKTANVGDTVDVGGNAENQITVFKSPTCSCCAAYIDYLKDEGFAVKVENVRDTLAVKEKYQIPSELESCHTSLIGDYVVEGHAPVEAVKKLLQDKPDILGIALPGMPPGSPGMGGYKKESFKIYQLLRGGEISEYGNF